MNKFLIVFTIILLICIIVALCAILVFTIKNGNRFDFSFSIGEDYNKIMEEEFDIENIDNLKMNYKVGNIYIKQSEKNNVKVIAYGKEDDEIRCEIIDRTLSIEDFLKEEIDFVGKKRKIEVFLPNGYSNTIICDGNAGNINIDDFKNAKLNINTKAGNVSVQNAEFASITTDAGNIKVKKVPELRIVTKAGNINVDEITKKCSLKSDAGNIKVSNLLVSENSSIETDMGNINIDETSDINVQTKNSLGKVNDENNNKNSNITVYVKTDIGIIHVK